jgi:hypothetical protein
MNSHKVVRLVSVLGLLLLSPPAWAWFAEGHEIVAIIATDDLTPTAKSHVAQILGVPAGSDSVEKAMAAASIRPDTEFREQDRATAPWHYIDICLQDSQANMPARCPQGNCVTAKIDEYARRLRNGDYDKWGRSWRPRLSHSFRWRHPSASPYYDKRRPGRHVPAGELRSRRGEPSLRLGRGSCSGTGKETWNPGPRSYCPETQSALSSWRRSSLLRAWCTVMDKLFAGRRGGDSNPRCQRGHT